MQLLEVVAAQPVFSRLVNYINGLWTLQNIKRTLLANIIIYIAML